MASYYNRIAGFIDAVQPGLSVKEDVNSGNRTGVRASVRISPSDRLTITPRFLFQKVEMDGWNRVDVYNILGNQFTTTRPAVMLGERQQFTQLVVSETSALEAAERSRRADASIKSCSAR